MCRKKAADMNEEEKMSEQLKCKVCGRTFYKHEILDGLNLFAERICPDCKRQRAFSGGGGEILMPGEKAKQMQN